jgi:hypothetical protein
VAASVGGNHVKVVGKLIKDYRKLKRVDVYPLVVMFEQTKEVSNNVQKGIDSGFAGREAICHLRIVGNG